MKSVSNPLSIGNKSALTFALGAMLFAVCFCAEAQQSKIYKISELTACPGLGRSSDEFVRALRELGYVEGKNIAFDVRSAEGKPERFRALADELVRLKVDVLVATNAAEALAFKSATKTIPIVFYTGGDPVGAGLVDSLARPGENITGVTLTSAELVGKRLELLKQTIPTLRRVAVLWNPQTVNISPWQESLLPARELGLQLHSMEVSSADKLETAFKEAIRVGSAALTMQLNPLFVANQKQIVDMATKNRLAGDIPSDGFCRERWLNVLRSRPRRTLQARCRIGG